MLAEGRCSPTATMILSSHRLVMRVTRESCAHEGSLADLGMRFCGLLAEVTRPSDEYWRSREATRDEISQVSALHEHLASVTRVVGDLPGTGGTVACAKGRCQRGS